MKICILGTGAYGLALAVSLNRNNDITMWTKFEEEKNIIDSKHMYERVLPKVIIPNNIYITTSIEEAVRDKDLIIIAIPVKFIDNTCKDLKKYYNNQCLCIASKGIDDTLLFMHQILEKYFPINNITVISGASFAIDTVKEYPIGLTVAGKNGIAIDKVKLAFSNTNIRLQETNDMIGVEICGSIKNVVALGCGILDGIGVTESTKAKFITEALQGIVSLIQACGGNYKTVISYSGIGDLILTCTSSKSRNFSLGKIIATQDKGLIKEYINNHTVEGLNTLNTIIRLMNTVNLDIPIFRNIHNVIYNNVNLKILV